MRRVTAREANQQFSALLALASGGEEIVITRHGEPVATLAPYKAPLITPERQAAVERAIELMERGLSLGIERPFTRDEMHER
jgi:prevent-host-death family protein